MSEERVTEWTFDTICGGFYSDRHTFPGPGLDVFSRCDQVRYQQIVIFCDLRTVFAAIVLDKGPYLCFA